MSRSTALRFREVGARLHGRREYFVSGGASRLARRPRLEVLETRVAPATFLVTSALDAPGVPMPGSLRAALDQANRPGEAPATILITPAVSATAIRLQSGELVVSNTVTLENQSGHTLDIVQATRGARVLHVLADPRATQVQLVGQDAANPLVIEGGQAAGGNGGGILVDARFTQLTLVYTVVTGNLAFASGGATTGQGGGIYTPGNVTLVQSSVSGNRAPDGTGGGIVATSGSVTLELRSHVDGNQARDIGGVMVGVGDVSLLEGSSVSGNQSTGGTVPRPGNLGGGGIAVTLGHVLVSASDVADNRTVGMYSGGIVILLGDVMVTEGSHIVRNVNNGPGGGIAANFGGTVTISGGSEVSDNTAAGLGGGIVNFSATLGGVAIADGSRVQRNVLTNAETLTGVFRVLSAVLGGPIRQSLAAALGADNNPTVAQGLAEVRVAGTATLKSFHSAAAAIPGQLALLVAGGGVATLLGAPITISGGSIVGDNVAGRSVRPRPVVAVGGGVFAGIGSLTLSSSLVTGNKSFGSGGGLWAGGPLHVSQSILSRNISTPGASSAFGGGAYLGGRAATEWAGTLITENQADQGGGIYNAGRTALVDSAVVNNIAQSRGGGILNAGRLVTIRTLVENNQPDNIAT